MKKNVFYFLILFSNLIFSQNIFEYHKDFDKILAETKDASSVLNYDVQLKKYNSDDKEQTDNEMLALLIGHTAKATYKPYSDLSIANDLYELNEKGKYQEAVNSANKMLKSNPFHIKVLIEICYALNGLGKTEESINYNYRMFKIYKAMAYSCNGDFQKYPIFALSPKDGECFIKFYIRWQLGTVKSSKDENGDLIDVLEAKKGNESITYRFFIQHTIKNVNK